MALEALSNAVYHDTAKLAQKTEYRGNSTQVQGSGTMDINITETPAVMKLTNSNPNGNEPGKGQKENSATTKQIKDAISKANNKMKSSRTRCEFSYHEETKRVSIKVLDQDTNEVIREIPPEESLEMLEKMWELAGLIVDEKR